MRALTLSAVLLLAGTAAAAVTFERTPFYYDCGPGSLDLPCRPENGVRRLSRVGPAGERYADKAYVIRFGGSGRHDARPGWDVKAGNVMRQALFIAAVLTTFIL